MCVCVIVGRPEVLKEIQCVILGVSLCVCLCHSGET